ncbi:mediator of RNA polymerase II transcription subunit 27-like [Zophobas morio]|uniref:mediator of RNA polymerase II transcription subunit 27-like n=1 Tax=Zophobas morio TaxID=2755281 RepID=UPI003083E05A
MFEYDFFSSPSLTFGDSFDSDSIQGTGSTPRDINSEYVSVLEKINDSLKLIGDLRKGVAAVFFELDPFKLSSNTLNTLTENFTESINMNQELLRRLLFSLISITELLKGMKGLNSKGKKKSEFVHQLLLSKITESYEFKNLLEFTTNIKRTESLATFALDSLRNSLDDYFPSAIKLLNHHENADTSRDELLWDVLSSTSKIKIEKKMFAASCVLVVLVDSLWRAHLLLRPGATTVKRVTVCAWEESNVGLRGSSRFLVFQRLSDIWTAAVWSYRDGCKDSSPLKLFLNWIQSYENLFESVCVVCQRCLGFDSADHKLLPPLQRSYVAPFKPYHTHCLNSTHSTPSLVGSHYS